MRIKTVFISQLIVLFLYPCFSQDSYRVGFSSTTLEPDDKFASLTLAGYAGPWEGRFTLHWKEKGTMPAYLGFTGGDGHLFFVDGQSLYRSSKNTSRWEKIGDASGIRQIAAETNIIYGVDSEGQLKKNDLSRKRPRWKNLGRWDQPVLAIAVSGNKLYLADQEGLFHVAKLGARKLKWEKASFLPLKGVISLAGDADKLLALTREGVLYQQGWHLSAG